LAWPVFFAGNEFGRHVWIIDLCVRPFEANCIAGALGEVRDVAFMNETRLTEARVQERAATVLGPAARGLWRGRVAHIDDFRGWSLASLTPSRQ